jgi:hypothetical protein
VLTVIDALPEERVLLPITVEPLRNCTVPEGVPLAAVIVAVNVTAWPVFEGLRDEVSDVVVAIVETEFTI